MLKYLKTKLTCLRYGSPKFYDLCAPVASLAPKPVRLKKVLDLMRITMLNDENNRLDHDIVFVEMDGKTPIKGEVLPDAVGAILVHRHISLGPLDEFRRRIT